MPHIIVKLYPGQSEEQKRRMTDEIVAAVCRNAKCDVTAVSVAFEEVRPDEWAEKVYKPGAPQHEPEYPLGSRLPGPPPIDSALLTEHYTSSKLRSTEKEARLPAVLGRPTKEGAAQCL